MNKLLIASILGLVTYINSQLPADCQTDNGKRIDNCVIIDGKEIYR